MDAPNGLPVDSAVDSEMDSGGVRPALQADSAPDSAVVKIYPGNGVPGMPGYDSTPHELTCR